MCTNTKIGSKCECTDDEGEKMLNKDGNCIVASDNQLQEVKDDKKGQF